jgi:hypothetical protein
MRPIRRAVYPNRVLSSRTLRCARTAIHLTGDPDLVAYMHGCTTDCLLSQLAALESADEPVLVLRDALPDPDRQAGEEAPPDP